MNIVEEIKEIIGCQNLHEKENGLNRMNDVFEYGHGYDLNEENIVESVKILLAAALREEDPMMKRRFLRTIFQAVVFSQGKYLGTRIDWEPLAALLPSLDKWQLEYVLVVLSLTGQEKYTPILDRYTHYADPEIRDWAFRAISNVKILAAHYYSSQKDT